MCTSAKQEYIWMAKGSGNMGLQGSLVYFCHSAIVVNKLSFSQFGLLLIGQC